MTVRADILTWLSDNGFAANRAFLCEDGSGTPAENFGDTVNSGGSLTWGTDGTYGGYVELDATSDWFGLSTSSNFLTTDKQTIIIARKVRDTTNRASYAFAVDLGGNDARRCSSHIPYSDGTVYWDFGGLGGNNRITWGGYSKNTSVFEVWVFRAGTLGSKIVLNGITRSSHANVITRTGTTNQFRVNQETSVAGDLQNVFFVAVIPDELPDHMLAKLVPDVFVTSIFVGVLDATGVEAFTSSANLKALGSLSATGSIAFTSTAPLTSSPPSRVTQLTADIISAGDPENRVTQLTADVISAGDSENRVTQLTVDVISDGEFKNIVTQLTADVIADVIAHTPNVRFTQLSVDVICEPPVEILTPSPLFNAWLNKPYSVFIVASGGLGTLTWTITAGSVPTGFSISPTTGEITGPMTETGLFSFTVTVTDNVGNSASVAYTLFVDNIAIAAVNLGIGPLGLGYTVRRGVSGIECHFEFIAVGIIAGSSHLYRRSILFFPGPGVQFPDDQKFYLEAVGQNLTDSNATWIVTDGSNSQTLVFPPGYVGRIRNTVPFDKPFGFYAVTSTTPGGSFGDVVVTAFRIVAPLKSAQRFVSEVELINSYQSTELDQTIGGGDAFRTSLAGHEGLDDGWVPAGITWRYEAAAWEHIAYVNFSVVMANASFFDQAQYKYSEVALVDIDDIEEFAFRLRISTKNIDVFLSPSVFGFGLNPTALRDGHRYQVWARSVKPDGFFTFDTYLHTANLQLGLDPANSAEIYNRCGSQVYMPGAMVPSPEIYYQVDSGDGSTNYLKDFGASTRDGSTSVSGPDIAASAVVSAADDSVRSVELGSYLTGGHDYAALAVNQNELVYRLKDVLRRPRRNYMF